MDFFVNIFVKLLYSKKSVFSYEKYGYNEYKNIYILADFLGYHDVLEGDKNGNLLFVQEASTGDT